jgi:hypothetical protein
MYLILVVLLILVIAGFPTWPYAAGWGWGPSGLGGLLLLVLLIMLLTGHL